MLHLGILPHHEQWAAFLAGLTHVVVDEAHTYRGVFGAHMAQVFRRLNRLAGRYGARPTYVLCTATVGNPGELASGLIGAGDSAPVVVEEPDAMAETPRPADAPVVIDTSGAPQGPRHFVFLNPEQSPATAAIDLLKAALARNLRTIVYCRSRRMTELVSLWAGSRSGPYKERISAYRAGFLPEERRSIEARMASGELLAVVSTSALELGIDIGGLDVCILVGYPGTVMATLQRGGRVGRAQQESAVIVVAGEDALDQYFARNPEDYQALNYVGYSLAEQGKDLDRAVLLLEAALKQAPDHAYILDSLAWAHFRRGENAEAWALVRRATSLPDGGDPTIWEHYGDIANAQGLKNEARTGWERALELDHPNPENIRKKLNSL